jgi:hypothetical protein
MKKIALAVALIVTAALGLAIADQNVVYSDQTPLVYSVTIAGTNSPATCTLISSNAANCARTEMRVFNTSGVAVDVYSGATTASVKIVSIADAGSISFAAPAPELGNGLLSLYARTSDTNTSTAVIKVLVRPATAPAIAR